MLKIQFTNATVSDDGFGLSVNGNSLSAIISTALGTKVGNHYGYDSELPRFKSNCCNVTVIIEPQFVGECIETDDEVWYSVEDLEECKREQYKEKISETES